MKCHSFVSVLTGILFFTSLPSCSRNDKVDPIPQLPPITLEGKNTFGCKVNGEVWLPYKPLGDVFTGPLLSYYYNDKRGLYIGAQANRISHYEWMQVNAICPDTGTFQIIINSTENIVFTTNKSGTYYNYELSDSNSFNLIRILKLDTLKFVIAGTFQFTAYDPIKKDSVYITEGRFDIKYK